MKNKLIFLIIALGIVAQFGLLSTIIIRRELTLRYGEVCRFETAPVDPFDAFRGQYVQLSYEALSSGVLSGRSFTANTWCYLLLTTDTNGYQIVSSITDLKPTSGTFIRTRVRYSYEDHIEKPTPDNKYHREPTGKWKVYLNLPFDRYYMPEKLAPQAETAYRAANRASRKEKQAVARVRIWRGMVVIEDIEIDGKTIREVIQAERLIKP